jgi:hypothetical protein
MEPPMTNRAKLNNLSNGDTSGARILHHPLHGVVAPCGNLACTRRAECARAYEPPSSFPEAAVLSARECTGRTLFLAA